jgi:hypothetical protein
MSEGTGFDRHPARLARAETRVRARFCPDALPFSFDSRIEGNNPSMILLLVLLIVLIFAGAGFALHVLWIAAVIFALFWLIGAAVGRGESAGRHRFYRW